jgi:lysophospholipid acyltransferase
LPFVALASNPRYELLSMTLSWKAGEPFLKRIVDAWIAVWCMRCKYYVAWGIAEASYKASGAAPFVSHHGRNVRVWDVELPRSVHSVTSAWNVCTSDWLKHYVYLPTRNQLKARGVGVVADYVAIITTNVTSALWHGLYPGYFLTFFGAGACTVIGRLLYKNVEPHFQLGGALEGLWPLYETLFVLWAWVMMITFIPPSQLYTFSYGWKAWENLHFIGHAWLGGAFIVSFLFSVCVSVSRQRDVQSQEKIE